MGEQPSRAVAPAVAGRLVLERITLGWVVGWCVTANQGVAELALLVDGQPLPTETRRAVRPDVDAALGLARGGEHGFSVRVPWQAWVTCLGVSDEMPRVTLKSTDAEAPLSLKGGWSAWCEQLQALGPGLEFERALQDCLRMAVRVQRECPQAMDAVCWAWLSLQAELRGWQILLADPDAPGPEPVPVRGKVEAFEATVLRGWACAIGGADEEQIRLCANGVPIPAGVIRTCRDDVQHALRASRLQLGFEIEVPSLVWAAKGPATAVLLTVLVNGQLIDEREWQLDATQLTHELERLHQQQARLETQGILAVDPREFQYRVLLAAEHVAASGLWSHLSASLQRFVWTQAERFGLTDALSVDESGEPGAVSRSGPVVDPTTLSVWRVLRQFNAAWQQSLPVGTGVTLSLGLALDELLRATADFGEVRYRALQSLIPFFCSQRAYGLLRPHLPAHRLRMLGLSRGAWELSLALPEAVSAGDPAWACDLLEGLARGAVGWLNTECVGHAAHVLAEQLGTVPQDDAAVLTLVRRLLTWLEQMAADPWGRSHDLHLMDAMVSLLVLAPALPEPAARSVVSAAVRVYALSPDFWRTLSRRIPLLSAWPAPLREAQACLSLWQTESVDTGGVHACTPVGWSQLPLLRTLAGKRQSEATRFIREVTQAALMRPVPEREPLAAGLAAELALLDQAEVLRLAAHPLCPQPWLDQAADLKPCIRSVSGVPTQGRPELRASVWGRLSPTAAAEWPVDVPSMTDCRLLVRSEDGHLGLYLMALRWQQRRGRATVDEDLHALSELRECWLDVLERGATSDLPPPPLLDAYSLLARHPDAGRPGMVQALVREFEDRLGATAQALAVDSGMAAMPGAWANGGNTLVVIYSCRANLPNRVRLIRETWARDLSRRGIPWVVLVGDGHGALEADGVLGLACSDAYEDLPAKTVALVRWVLNHTPFDHLLKIDDDCHLAVDAFFDEAPHLTAHYLGRRLRRAEGGTDRRWHHGKLGSRLGSQVLDKSPEPSEYADGGAGYALSRLAMSRLVAQLATTAGARLTRSAFMEDKLVGDLLAQAGVPLSSVGYETLVRRRTGPGLVPVSAHQNAFYPSRHSPTLVSHLDDADQLEAVSRIMRSDRLLPSRIWPTTAAPVLGGVAGTNQLELLSPSSRVAALADAEVLVVAVARNERVLMPHFLAHYRRLGVSHFVLVDNLSDDGTREYLLEQPDVVLYSADTEYRHSHYGVAWQQAVLAAHALGKWVVLADIDEFLVFDRCEDRGIGDWLRGHASAGHDAVLTLMVDMYPQGDLAQADFSTQAPFEAAPYFDRQPLLPWRLGSGCFSNGPTYLSGLRHRLIPDSAPNLYTAQKVAVLRYLPWVRLSEGLHYASNIQMAAERACFCHFKYHAGFKAKVHAEIARRQHFNGAEEYRKYLAMVAEGSQPLHDAQRSVRYESSATLAALYAGCSTVD